MAEISGLGESSAIDRYDATVETEPKKVEAAEEEAQPQALPGESEKKLKANEDMHRALAPNLRNLDREQEIKVQLKVAEPPEQFSLLKELLKIKLRAFEAEGYSVKEFAQKMREAGEKKDRNFLLEGFHHELKKEIVQIYFQCSLLAGLKEIHGQQGPHFKLFEFEKETGFVVLGTELLKGECEALFDTFKMNNTFNIDIHRVRIFYWDVAFPNILTVFQLLEESGEQDFIKKEMESHTLRMFFDPNIYRKFPVVDKDPLIQLLPYIAKYSSLEKIEKYFNERYKDLAAWDKAYLWIDLHCQAAEVLASIDPNKSREYLEKAQKEQESKLWAYRFSPNRSAIEAKANESAARIEAAHLKCKESDALKAS